MVDGRPRPTSADVRWLLHTADAQGLYAKLGFAEAGSATYPLMERGRGYDAPPDELATERDPDQSAPPPTRPTPSRSTACCCCTPAAWTRA